MNGIEPKLMDDFDRVRDRAFAVGVIASAIAVIGAFRDPAQFFHSYLIAYLLWLGVALGCYALLMLHHLVGGGWGFPIRRLLEAGTRTMPLLGILVVPLLFGLKSLYTWADPARVAADDLLKHKAPYLNVPFFIIRTVVYIAVWLVLEYFLNKWSLEQDSTDDPAPTRKLQLISGPGLILYGLTITFASIDWVMSLEPHWFSTIYGMMYMAGEVLSSLAFIVIAVMLLSNRKPLCEVATKTLFHDLGNLTLAFVMVYAYLSFSQFLIIWAGNLVEEIPWYLRRLHGGWGFVALGLVLFHFFLPFLLLLSRDIKRAISRLWKLAVLLLVVRWLADYWMVEPALHPAHASIHWMGVLLPVGMGGIWIAAYVQQLKNRPLLPLNDPRMAPTLAVTFEQAKHAPESL